LSTRLPSLERALSLVRLDFEPARQQPSASRVATASVLSVAGSLAADAILVVIGTAIFPSTRGYVHFQFSDYAKLTIIGVVIACLAWPVVTRITSQPRWLFFRMAIAVTLVLWLPDLYILAKGQPPRAVAVLMVMHLAIAVVTYNCLVHIARVNAARAERVPAPGPDHQADRPAARADRNRTG
jgi:bacteriorhodopsin